MLFIDIVFSLIVSGLASLEALVVFILADLAFFATLTFLVMGAMMDSTSRVVNKEELNFRILLLWSKSV